jgi:hypothetical protein
MDPVRFERLTKTEAPKGCIVYLVAVPAVAFFLWVVLILVVHTALHAFGVPDPTINGINAGLLPLVLAAMIRWAWRDSRRGGRADVTISEDRVDVHSPRHKGRFQVDALRTIRLTPWYDDQAVIFVPKEGPPCPLPPDIASFDKVRVPLEASVVARLVQQMDEHVNSGQAVHLDDSSVRGLLRIVWGVLMFPLGVACIATLLLAGLGIVLLVSAPHRIRQGWRGLSGGFDLRSGGVAPSSGVVRKVIPWELLTLVKFDEDGLVLRNRRGGTLTLSPSAEEFWPASKWIAERLSKPAA